ncbi:hypothetical protein [Paludisphaera soli]|uniref:hypothetical protein n=1 Tax=Paludisphaera soli TaxID=2712865 RepID=UPI0013EB6AA5|nr:hypothetical protein [Paludisphaera soli]
MRIPEIERLTLATAVLLALAVVAPNLGCSRSSPDAAETADEPPGLDPGVLRSAAPIEALDDPRLEHLLEAASRWRERRGPERTVVDQVVLAADVPSFLAAVSAWDGHSFFPVLIDDPAWTLPFLRAFRPSRILRFRASAGPRGEGAFERWRAAQEAVGRAWVRHVGPGAETPPPSGAPPRGIDATPPGVVLSHPDSPSLAAAVALAAGRFQPLSRLEPMTEAAKPGERAKVLRFEDVATEDQAVAFARRVESRVASFARSYARLGDEVDFLTLAGDWPYRYRAEGGEGITQGDRALDDLVGRVLGKGEPDLEKLRTRWAFAGRILGDPPASVARAMGSLFFQPESALFWNTYSGGPVWSDYDVSGAAATTRLIRPAPGAVAARAGATADLASWRETFRTAGRYDLLTVNSSGGPGEFSITGGPGLAADVPLAPPRIAAMIHSFSAADPLDPGTIAGRFLERGTFAYYGSMNEPFLTAFRTPYLLAQLLSVEIPLGAAFRQGPYEAFGHPWRLVYLGDPLYRISPLSRPFRPERSNPEGWDRTALDEAGAAVLLAPRGRPEAGRAAETLEWCRDRVLLTLLCEPAPAADPEATSILRTLDRRGLDPARLATLDALLIDGFAAAGDEAGLLDHFLGVKPAGRSGVVWRAIETAALGRLAALERDGEFREVLDHWFRLVVGPWPSGSSFPARLTRRVARAAEEDAPLRRDAFRRRLMEARDRLAAANAPPDRIAMLAEELDRLVGTPADR